jgi:plastocyanin
MRFNGLVLAASAIALAACAGGGDKNANSASADTSMGAAAPAAAPAAPAAEPAAAPAPGAAAATAGTPAPITGKTHEVKMIGDAKGYRFEPANITLKVGDGVKFINVTGGPHNVAFNTVPPDSKAQLDANMPAQTGSGPGAKLGELSGPLLIQPNDSYTVSFAGVKPGKYDFNCTPHLALGMKGEITVQ